METYHLSLDQRWVKDSIAAVKKPVKVYTGQIPLKNRDDGTKKAVNRH